MIPSKKRWLLVIVLVGLILRLVWSSLVYSPPFKNPQTSMSKMYVRSAYLIVLGEGYSQTHPSSPAQTYIDNEIIKPNLEGKNLSSKSEYKIPREGLFPETLHPPGTSILAAAVMRVTGMDGWKALQLLGTIFDLMGIVLIWYLAALLCPSVKWLPFISSLIYAICPPLLSGVASARDIAFMAPLTLLSLYNYVRYYQSRKAKYFLLSALVTGVAAYFRPDALLFTAFLGLIHVGDILSKPSFSQVGKFLLRPLVAIGIALLLLLPWAIRNHEVVNRWVFTSTGAGCTLITGLGTFPNPWGFGRSDLDRHKEAQAAGYLNGFDPEADKFFQEKFINAIKSDPFTFAKIVLWRVPMSIAPPYSLGLEVPKDSFGQIRAKGEISKNIMILLKAYWPEVLCSLGAFLGLLGVFYLYRVTDDRSMVWLILLLPYTYVVAVHLLTHMAPYYLLPAISSQIIGLAFIISRLRSLR